MTGDWATPKNAFGQDAKRGLGTYPITLAEDELRLASWQALTSTGQLVPVPILIIYLSGPMTYSLVLSQATPETRDWIELHSINGRITLVAVFADAELRLSVMTSGLPLSIERPFTLEERIEIEEDIFEYEPLSNTQTSFEVNTWVRIKAAQIPNFTFIGYSVGGEEFNASDKPNGITILMNQVQNVTLIYEAIQHTVMLNGAPRTIQVDETITITLDPGAMNVTRGFAIFNNAGQRADAAMLERANATLAGNTVVISMTDEFITFLGTGGTMRVEGETAFNVTYSIMFALAGAIGIGAMVGMVFVFISMRKKKADYALALAKHKEANKRLSAAANISDLVRQAKEGGN
jgi:hypothetical protein